MKTMMAVMTTMMIASDESNKQQNVERWWWCLYMKLLFQHFTYFSNSPARLEDGDTAIILVTYVDDIFLVLLSFCNSNGGQIFI